MVSAPFTRCLLAILIAALIIRLAWGMTRPVSSQSIQALPDQAEYLALGKNLLRGEGLRFVESHFDDWVYAYRMPGYPLMVAACGANVRWIRIVQAVLDTLTVLAVYLLGRRVVDATPASRRALWLSVAFVAFNPFLIYFSGLILSETLFTSMLAWGMYWLTAPSNAKASDGNPGRTLLWLLGGMVLALSVLVRPSAIGLPVVLGVAAAFVNQRANPSYQSRWPIPVATTMSLLVIAVLLPWALRNREPGVLGRWVWTTTNGGITAYDGFNPDASGASDQRFLKRLPQLREMGEVARSEYLSNRAQQFIREHPRRALELALVKMGRTWSPAPLSDSFCGRGYRLVALAYAVPFDLLALAGLIIGRMRLSAKVFLLLPAIYFTAVHAATVGSLRYRIPVEPPMALLIASLFQCRDSASPPTDSSTAPGGAGTRFGPEPAVSDVG